MQKRIAALLIFGIAILWGNYVIVSNVQNDVRPETKMSARYAEPDTRPTPGTALLTGRIVELTESALILRIAEWATGNDLHRALMEAGKCDIERLASNECSPNGFFVRETDVRVPIPLSTNLTIDLIGYETADGSPGIKTVDIHALAEHLRSSTEYPPLFWITLMEGEVAHIEEQYIP